MDGVAFVPSFANVSAFSTDDGLVMVDTGSKMFARFVHADVRQWREDRLHTAIYWHGHIDHVFGVPFFIFRGEPFWGYDRMPLLEQRLAEAGLVLSARAPAA